MDFTSLWVNRDEILEHLLTRKRAAAAAKPEETYAATTIQRHFRGSIVRARVSLESYAAMEVQRIFRGYIDRNIVRKLLEMRDTERRRDFESYCASEIQRIYRGFVSRKYNHNFHARREYIASVTSQGEKLRKQLQEQLDKQIEETLIREEEKAMDEFDNVTQNLHHLVSTRAQPGVFNPPYAEDESEIPSAFQIPVEAHLRRGTQRFLRTSGYKTTKAFRTQDNKPISYVSSRQSLASSAPYDACQKVERDEKRLNELKQLSPKPFLAGTRVRHEDLNDTIRATESFIDSWIATKMTRDLDNTALSRSKRVGAKQGQTNFVSSAKRNRAFDDIERERLRTTNYTNNRTTSKPLNQQFSIDSLDGKKSSSYLRNSARHILNGL